MLFQPLISQIQGNEAHVCMPGGFDVAVETGIHLLCAIGRSRNGRSKSFQMQNGSQKGLPPVSAKDNGHAFDLEAPGDPHGNSLGWRKCASSALQCLHVKLHNMQDRSLCKRLVALFLLCCCM